MEVVDDDCDHVLANCVLEERFNYERATLFEQLRSKDEDIRSDELRGPIDK